MSQKGLMGKVFVTMMVLAAAAAATAALQLDSEPPVEPMARHDCPPVVVGNLSVVNASNPTEIPADLVVRVFDKAGNALLSKSVHLEPGESDSVEVRFDRRFGFEGRLLRGQVDQIDGVLGILVTFQALQRGIGGLTAGPNVICTTPNRPF